MPVLVSFLYTSYMLKGTFYIFYKLFAYLSPDFKIVIEILKNKETKLGCINEKEKWKT
jgi:hypothetical protein